MKDVKQKHQEKIIERKIREQKEKEERDFIISMMEQKKYSWRKKLIEEGMTTDTLFYTQLSATGEQTLSDLSPSIQSNYTLGAGTSYTGNTISFVGGVPDSIEGGPVYYARALATRSVDTTVYDTVAIDVLIDSIGATEDVVIWKGVGNPSILIPSGSSSGTYTYSIPVSDGTTSRNTTLYIIQAASSPSRNFQITNIRFLRRNPVNVFVSLDSPEAVSFVRTGSGDLSPEEKQQRLKEMLEASDEYVQQIYGDEFPGSGSVAPGEAGDTPGVEIAQVYPSDYEQERKTDQMLLKGLQRGDYGTGPQIDKQIRQIQQNLQRGTPGGLPLA